MSGIPLKSMTHSHYLFHDSKPIFPGNGVYIFKINNKIVYIGKSGSRSFIERIPCHLDFREWAWMNSLLKAYCNNNKLEINEPNLIEASEEMIKAVNLILINFDTPVIKDIKSSITQLEDILLRSELTPWNKRNLNLYTNPNTNISLLINL